MIEGVAVGSTDVLRFPDQHYSRATVSIGSRTSSTAAAPMMRITTDGGSVGYALNHNGLCE